MSQNSNNHLATELEILVRLLQVFCRALGHERVEKYQENC